MSSLAAYQELSRWCKTVLVTQLYKETARIFLRAKQKSTPSKEMEKAHRQKHPFAIGPILQIYDFDMPFGPLPLRSSQLYAFVLSDPEQQRGAKDTA